MQRVFKTKPFLQRIALRASSSSSLPPVTNPNLKNIDPFRDRTYSVDEALFLAKEAGIFTTAELQKQIIRSPSFSPDKSPFALENFFQPQEADQPEVEESESDEEEDMIHELTAADVVAYGSGDTPQVDRTPPARQDDLSRAIHDTIVKTWAPEWEKTFWHNGREWLARAEGRGTRKRSVAHAVIVRGTGIIKVNGDEDFWKRWWIINDRMQAAQPFYLAKCAGIYDCHIGVAGGGPSGQSGAARLAIARALLAANPACSADLKAGMALFEDTRQRLPKEDRLEKARARRSWSKR